MGEGLFGGWAVYRRDAINRLTMWSNTSNSYGYFRRYVYDAQNRRAAKYYVFLPNTEAMLRDRAAKLYCAAVRSAGFSPSALAWMRGEGINPYLGAPVHESSVGVPPANPAALPFPPAGMSGKMPDLPLNGESRCGVFTTERTEHAEMVGGSAWLDERAAEALLRRAGALRSPSAGSLPVLDPYMRFYEIEPSPNEEWFPISVSHALVAQVMCTFFAQSVYKNEHRPLGKEPVLAHRVSEECGVRGS